MSGFFEKLTAAAGNTPVLCGEELKAYTTFRIGGPARYFLSPEEGETAVNVIRLCREEHVPYAVIGRGSNLLVSDEGYDGVIIHFGEKYSAITRTMTPDGQFAYRVQAGALLSQIARQALLDSRAGFEFAAGIPGTIGGGAIMNAGAYGGELADVLLEATVLTPEGNIRVLSREEMELGYRTSRMAREGDIVLSALIALPEGNPEEIRGRMDELAAKRREKQPLEYPSAGSTFKRPAGYFAGKLIEDAGLKGYRVGDAQVSEKHAGFVINRGEASASDVLRLCREVEQKVEEMSGVRLEMEIRLLGF